MQISVASEHIKDGTDCLSEAIKNIKRVQKAFPEHVNTLHGIQTSLETTRSDLVEFHKVTFNSK